MLLLMIAAVLEIVGLAILIPYSIIGDRKWRAKMDSPEWRGYWKDTDKGFETWVKTPGEHVYQDTEKR